MSQIPPSNSNASYGPLPNPVPSPTRGLDLDSAPPEGVRLVNRDSYAAVESGPPTPDPTIGEFDLSTSMAMPRPRFMQDGDPVLRQSLASIGTDRAPSEGVGSVYALRTEGSGQFNPYERASSYYAANSLGGRYTDDPNAARQDIDDEQGVPMEPQSTVGSGANSPRFLSDKVAMYGTTPRAASRRKWWVWGGIAALIALIIVVVVPVYFGVIKKSDSSRVASGSSSNSNSDGSSSNGSGPSSGSSPVTAAVVTGGKGSQVTMDDGTQFTFNNPYGGTWYYDADDPFNNGARPQSWSPALNETFNYGSDRIRGVNIGGWLVTEPFIAPALYQKYPNVIDEWGLSEAMRADTANGGISQLEDHYKTFITEADFYQIAAAGLNYVRIPLGFWAIETRDGEPFLANTSWQYFLKAIKWARKYGLRINLDFHTATGSQNGWNHSGRLGTMSFLNGTMGYANAQRTLDYIRIIAEFISQPEYSDVVTMFGILNEPRAIYTSNENIQRFYVGAYDAVRLASGIGAGKGPIISFHDAFNGLPWWKGFLPGADRIALDYHPYVAFNNQPTDSIEDHLTEPCTTWGSIMNTSWSAFGVTGAGEFSNAITDCGTYLNGVGQGSRYEGDYIYDFSNQYKRVGSCDSYIQWQKWDDDYRAAVKTFTMASMDALQNWFFWTWKVGNSSTSGTVESPNWSYSLGLQEGWIPTDPREAVGQCGNTAPWTGTLAASATGGATASALGADATDGIEWPPTTITNAGPITELPSYTATGPIPTLSPPALTATASSAKSSTISAGSGWNNPQDNAGLMVPINGCQYNDAWLESAEPTPAICTPAAKRGLSPPAPTITAPPTPRGFRL